MQFVGGEVESYPVAVAPLFLGSFALILASGFSPLPSVSFLWEFLGVEVVAELPSEVAKGSPKGFCEGVKRGQCVVSVKTKLGVGMPSCEEENEIQDVVFVLIRRLKSFDHWNDALWFISRMSDL